MKKSFSLLLVGMMLIFLAAACSSNGNAVNEDVTLVPNVIGLKGKEAEKKLEELGFEVVREDKAASDVKALVTGRDVDRTIASSTVFAVNDVFDPSYKDSADDPMAPDGVVTIYVTISEYIPSR